MYLTTILAGAVLFGAATAVMLFAMDAITRDK